MENMRTEKGEDPMSKKLVLNPEDDFLSGKNPWIPEDHEFEESYDMSYDPVGNLDR